MNKIVLCLVSFLAGSCAGFLVTQKLLDKKYAKLAEEEISSVKEAFERTRVRTSLVKPDLMSVGQQAKKEAKEELGIKSPSEGILSRSSLDNNPYNKVKRNYNLISKANEEKESEIEEDENDEPDDAELRDAAGMSEEDMLALQRIDRTQPYIISDRSYAEEYNHYDKVSLYYYRVDDVLTEENEEIVDDIDGTIGYDALNKLDMQSSVWVRNEPLAIDYEVISFSSSYAEAIGMHVKPISQRKQPRKNMTPREEYEEKQKRRDKDGGE